MHGLPFKNNVSDVSLIFVYGKRESKLPACFAPLMLRLKSLKQSFSATDINYY